MTWNVIINMMIIMEMWMSQENIGYIVRVQNGVIMLYTSMVNQGSPSSSSAVIQRKLLLFLSYFIDPQLVYGS